MVIFILCANCAAYYKYFKIILFEKCARYFVEHRVHYSRIITIFFIFAA